MTCYSQECHPKPLTLIGTPFVRAVERWLIISSYIVRLLWGYGIGYSHKLGWCGSGSICDTMVISFKCFMDSTRGKTLWKITSLTLLWIVWRERNAMIF